MTRAGLELLAELVGVDDLPAAAHSEADRKYPRHPRRLNHDDPRCPASKASANDQKWTRLLQVRDVMTTQRFSTRLLGDAAQQDRHVWVAVSRSALEKTGAC